MDSQLFHKQEHIHFFHRLVYELDQEPERMRWVMALWLYFESIGHRDLICQIASFSNPIIIYHILEAFGCLNSLIVMSGSGNDGLRYNTTTMATPVGLGYLYCHGQEAAGWVVSIYNNICCIIFNVVKEACPSDVRAVLLGSARIGPNGERMVQLMPTLLPSELEDHRSLFITFSRGFPISKTDIEEFFNSIFGPCVEKVMIQGAPPGQLPMYGKLVLMKANMIPVVLDGKQNEKFMIKHRHLWVRAYLPR